MSFQRRAVAGFVALIGFSLLAAACGGSTGLPTAVFTNVVDTVSLYALRGTAITLPSAYALEGATTVRTDQSTFFDFAFDFDSVGEPALFPTGAVNLGQLSGLQKSTRPFEAITVATGSGYIVDRPIAIDSGTVVIVRSRPSQCLITATVSMYAKLRVLGVDSTARRVDFEILVDQNCGYRGLAPGVPTQ